MKLSMHILADWLEKYKPTKNITSGQMILSGVRLYSETAREMDDTMLYIGLASGIFPGQFQNGQVICTNQADWILIETGDTVQILNDVLKAYEFYNEWEADLKEAAYSNCSFQTLIDLSYPVFRNPIFMVDWFGKVLGLTSQNEAKMDGTTWDYMRKEGYLPAYVYDLVKITNKQFKDIENNKEIFYLEVPQYDYHCFHCTVFVKNQPFLNFEVSKNTTELTEGMRLLMGVLREAVIILLRVSNAPVLRHPALQVFSDILSGRSWNPGAIKHTLISLGWEHTKTWNLVLFRNPFSGDMSRTVLLQQLGREIPRGFSFEWENRLMMLLDSMDWEGSELVLKNLLKDGAYAAGVSMPFNSIQDLLIGFKQANVALSYSKGDAFITQCADYAWGYMLNEFIQTFKIEKMHHPAIDVLEDYDRKNDSDLSKTFYEYLRNERSMHDTANKLYIHRNTLRYRLEQINDLIDVDLSNPDTRIYLLFSYLIKEQEPLERKIN